MNVDMLRVTCSYLPLLDLYSFVRSNKRICAIVQEIIRKRKCRYKSKMHKHKVNLANSVIYYIKKYGSVNVMCNWVTYRIFENPNGLCFNVRVNNGLNKWDGDELKEKIVNFIERRAKFDFYARVSNLVYDDCKLLLSHKQCKILNGTIYSSDQTVNVESKKWIDDYHNTLIRYLT